MPMTPVYDIQPPLELLKKGKAAEAIPMLEFIASEMPSHVSCHVLLAQAYAAEERWQESLSSWQNASFLMPNSPVIRKGFRDVLRILSRQSIKLIATTPEPEAEDAPADQEMLLDKIFAGDTAPDVAAPDDAEVDDSETDLEPSTASQASAGVDIDELIESQPAPEEAGVDEAAEPAIEETGNDEATASKVDDPRAKEAEAMGAADEEAETAAVNLEAEVAPKPADEESDDEESDDEESDDAPPNIFAREVPPTLAHLATDPATITEDLELDDLIQELESARIVPKPEHEIIETPVLEADIDDMVSETLARIYEGQKQFKEAARVYEKLAVMQPDRASDFEQRATELRARAAGSDAV